MTLPPKLVESARPLVAIFSDVRNVGLSIFTVIVMLVSWSGVKAIQTNYDLQKRISVLEQQIEVRELKNQNQRLKNAYLETDQYLELSARKQFGLAAPGETVWLIPESVARTYVKDLSVPEKAPPARTIVTRSEGQDNFQAWLDFFLHRSREKIE